MLEEALFSFALVIRCTNGEIEAYQLPNEPTPWLTSAALGADTAGNYFLHFLDPPAHFVANFFCWFGFPEKFLGVLHTHFAVRIPVESKRHLGRPLLL